MWYRTGGLGAWTLALLLMLGCASTQEPTGPTRAGQEVPVFREFKGQQGPFADRGFFVVQRPETWRALWAGRQAPEVDFTRQSVLVALMGQQPTSGYEITIADVRATGQQVVAYVDETRPQPGEVLAQVITYPYSMVVVPKITQQVAFNVGEPPVTPIAVQDTFVGESSNVSVPQTVVIRDENAWNLFWANAFGPTATPPRLNFADNVAVAVMAGTRPTGGYSVQILSADRADDRLVVNYRVLAPAPNTTVPQVATAPYAIAVIPATPLPIAFRSVPSPAIAAAR